MSLPEITNTNTIIKKNKLKRNIIYGAILLLFILAIIIIFILLKRRAKGKTDNDLLKKIIGTNVNTLAATENGKPVYLDEEQKILKVNLDDDGKDLIAKAVLGQVNKNVASVIEYYKELFQKNIIEKSNYTPFTLSITDYLNSTSAFTLEESKFLYKTIETLKTDFEEFDAKYAVNDLVGEDKYLRIVKVLKQKKPSDYAEPSRRVSEYVPLLNDVFKDFNMDAKDDNDKRIENFFSQDEDNNFELLSELLFSRGEGFESDRLLRELMELDSDTLSKLMPFMIQVVKDSEGFEKDAGFNLLRRMAQSLNLNVDNVSDLDALEAWWKQNKSNAASKEEKQLSTFEINTGFNIGDSFVIYTEENGRTIEFSGKITGGDKYSITYTAQKKLLLDSVICTYRPDLRNDENILRINDHTFFRLVEIAKIEDNLYKHVSFFITPNQKSEGDIKNFTSLMFGGLNQ